MPDISTHTQAANLICANEKAMQIEAIRANYNSVQHALIASHVTLCGR